jgi:hypothetical protein
MPQEVDSQLTLSDPPNPLKKATVYTQVKLPPLIPPMYLGETGKISSLPFLRAMVYTQVLLKIKSAVRNRNYTGKTPNSSSIF